MLLIKPRDFYSSILTVCDSFVYLLMTIEWPSILAQESSLGINLGFSYSFNVSLISHNYSWNFSICVSIREHSNIFDGILLSAILNAITTVINAWNAYISI